jgi:hypothetical protein
MPLFQDQAFATACSERQLDAIAAGRSINLDRGGRGTDRHVEGNGNLDRGTRIYRHRGTVVWRFSLDAEVIVPVVSTFVTEKVRPSSVAVALDPCGVGVEAVDAPDDDLLAFVDDYKLAVGSKSWAMTHARTPPKMSRSVPINTAILTIGFWSGSVRSPRAVRHGLPRRLDVAAPASAAEGVRQVRNS